MHGKLYATGVALSFLAIGCAEQKPPTKQQTLTEKPVSYPASSSLFTIISPDGADVSQPWKAQDRDLLSNLRSRAVGGSINPGVINSITSPCSGGGSTTTTTDNQGAPWYSEGDVFTTTYNDCVRGNTQVNGERQYSVDVMLGQQFIDPNWSLTTTMTRDIVNTDLLTSAISSVQGNAKTAVVVSNSTQYLQTLEGGWRNERPNDGVQVIDTTQYLVTYEWDEAPGGSYSWDFELITTSTNPLFADVTSRTLETLVGLNNQAPETGKMEIIQTLDGLSKLVTITALGENAVLVETDLESDGLIDSALETSWQEVVLDSFLYQFF